MHKRISRLGVDFGITLPHPGTFWVLVDEEVDYVHRFPQGNFRFWDSNAKKFSAVAVKSGVMLSITRERSIVEKLKVFGSIISRQSKNLGKLQVKERVS